MELAVEQVLAARRAPSPRRPLLAGLAAALVLHLVGIAAAVLLPRLAAPPTAPVEYVSVQIVPAQALGTPSPAPPPPQPQPQPKAPAKSEPPPPPPAKDPDIPQLPAAKPPKKAPPPAVKSGPQPAPAAPTAAPPAAASGAEPSPPGSPAGARTGPGGFSAEVEGVDPGFNYDYYLDQMLALIHSQWSRPTIGGEIQAVLHFRVLRSGEVTDLAIVQSSGYNGFDLAALRAVQNASPLPPLPRSYREDTLGVTLIVH